jgi:MFS family permease
VSVEPQPEPEAPVEAAPAAPAPEPQPVPELAPVAVMVETAEPIEAAPLGDRVRTAGRVGAGLGAVAAILVALFSSSWLLPRSGASEVEGGFDTVLDVISGWVITGSALIGIAVGLAVAATTRVVAGLASPGMRLVSSSFVSGAVGAVAGGLFGAAIGALVVGSGAASGLDPTIQVVPVLPALLWLVFGWTAAGWAIAALVQSLGVPAGVDDLESEETGVVKRRLTNAFGIPALAALTLLLFILPMAYIFIQFPSFAPLLAGIISIGILGFASLAASRPGMRITTGEFLAAAAGIGVVLLILVSVLLVQGVGHGEEEDEDHSVEEVGEPEAGVLVRLA